MLAHENPIVVIAEEGVEEEAVISLGRIGFDNVARYLAGGLNALAAPTIWWGGWNGSPPACCRSSAAATCLTWSVAARSSPCPHLIRYLLLSCGWRAYRHPAA